ncbi:AVB_G0031570.mRNA.1.CDS.1 [Saccharomyces cerevisiae]|nr:AVB_G0031570.mRNA.1.CDS.1 [Saccharomyces cerevisiae]CAI7193187.1 AVB_G0031570.mRNA.1.CDS.1 [Saccharomyces cerevisiae]
MDRKRSFEKLSFPSWSGKMYKVPDVCWKTNQISRADQSPSKYLIPKKINLMVYTLFQVHTLKIQ